MCIYIYILLGSRSLSSQLLRFGAPRVSRPSLPQVPTPPPSRSIAKIQVADQQVGPCLFVPGCALFTWTLRGRKTTAFKAFLISLGPSFCALLGSWYAGTKKRAARVVAMVLLRLCRVYRTFAKDVVGSVRLGLRVGGRSCFDIVAFAAKNLNMSIQRLICRVKFTWALGVTIRVWESTYACVCVCVSIHTCIHALYIS